MAWPWKGGWHLAFPRTLLVTLMTRAPALFRSSLSPGQAPGLCSSVSTPQGVYEHRHRMGSAEQGEYVWQGSLQVPVQSQCSEKLVTVTRSPSAVHIQGTACLFS